MQCSIEGGGKLPLSYFGQSFFKEKWQGMDIVHSCDKLELRGQFRFMGCQPFLDYLWGLVHFGVMAPQEEFPWMYYLSEVQHVERVALMNYRHNFYFDFKDGFGGE
jgi:hypothetical protein